MKVQNGIHQNQVWQVYEEDEWRPKSEERKDVKLSQPITAL